MDSKSYNSYTSTINERWKVCIFVSFLGCFMLLLCLRRPNQHFTSSTSSNLPSSATNIPPTIFTKNGSQILNQTRFSVTNIPPTIFTKNGSQILNQTTATKVENKYCNIFDGKWLYNPMQKPSYDKSKCPFLSNQVSCQRNGRPDSYYESWSWEAKDCQIPRFNGTEMLERLRGKRVIIVGDSLNRNQWESLACLLYSAIPPSRAIVNYQKGDYKVFTAKDYNCSVEFYWSPFLVELYTDQTNGTKVLRLDEIVTMAHRWQGADLMVFNTGHWWVHLRKWDLFERNGRLVEDIELISALEMAMKTWAKWVDSNVDSTKTSVFFRSISPEHKGKNWCYNQTKPIMDESYEPIFPKPVIEVVERTISEMRTPVKYLNITKLSQYRKDAHPTLYGTKKGKPRSFSDCSHWCLPGLPDTWNRLLFAHLALDTSSDSASSSHVIV
ncbi:protein trichome birefringence-like 42 [Cornus florida]|uniref:protein trichome birefringence-like 42 n=1 Tax=Cornus florida TaxID=4283 RepID=UPI00289EEA61|nr:protein trichome birefringence-like 42 [Cornus florida]